MKAIAILVAKLEQWKFQLEPIANYHRALIRVLASPTPATKQQLLEEFEKIEGRIEGHAKLLHHIHGELGDIGNLVDGSHEQFEQNTAILRGHLRTARLDLAKLERKLKRLTRRKPVAKKRRKSR